MSVANHVQIYAIGSVLPDGEKITDIQPEQVVFGDNGNPRIASLDIKKAPVDARFKSLSLTQLNQPWTQSLPLSSPGNKRGENQVMPADAQPANPFQHLAPDPLIGRKFSTVMAIRHDEAKHFAKILPRGLTPPRTRKPGALQ